MRQYSTFLVLFFCLTCVNAKNCTFWTNETEVCPFSVETLDFLHTEDPKHRDAKWLSEVHRNYPCEFRKFWAEGSFNSFVYGVRFIYKYLLPLEITFGVILNLFTIIMIKKKQSNLKKTRRSSAVYLLGFYQSWSDIGALVITCATGYARSYIPVFDKLFTSNTVFCRSYKIVTTFFQFLSPWINVIIALNRLGDIQRPLTRRAKVTSKTIHCTMLGLFSAAFVIALTKIHFSGFEEYSAFEYQSCDTRGRTDFRIVTLYVALSTWLPSTILLMTNLKLTNVLQQKSTSGFGDLLDDLRLLHRRKAQNKRIVAMIAAISVFYAFVQIPFGALEMIELYWNLIKRRTICRSDRNDFANWRIVKMVLKWVRALFYIVNQLGFIVNFSCLLWTTGDLRKTTRFIWHFALKPGFKVQFLEASSESGSSSS